MAIIHGLQDWMFVIIHNLDHRASCASVNIHCSSCSPDRPHRTAAMNGANLELIYGLLVLYELGLVFNCILLTFQWRMMYCTLA